MTAIGKFERIASQEEKELLKLVYCLVFWGYSAGGIVLSRQIQ